MKKVFLLFIATFLLTVSLFQVTYAKNINQEDKGPLTKITFIHYKKGHVKPEGASSKAKTTSCYGFLANGAKWKTTENFLINPTNSALNNDFVKQAIDNGVNEWEKYGGTAIFGESSIDTSIQYDPNLYDGTNSASFGSYPDNGVIAVTNIWGYFSGPPKTRELVEWDMLFNTNFTWGDATVNSTLMDLQNIATHELGHSAGMADLYNSCTQETMYGYSGEGETSKRDLNSGDIKGIQALY